MNLTHKEKKKFTDIFFRSPRPIRAANFHKEYQVKKGEITAKKKLPLALWKNYCGYGVNVFQLFIH